MKYFVFAAMLLSTSAVNAEMVWTDNSFIGEGRKVTFVYPQFANRDIMFKTDDGGRYRYHWGDSQQMTPNAQVVYSTLLAALASGKKVSIYYDQSDSKSFKKLL